jgi:hypothetical protein
MEQEVPNSENLIPQNQQTEQVQFAHLKPNLLIKIYLTLCGFVVIGVIVFLIKTVLSNNGITIPDYSPWSGIINFYLTIWGIVFAYLIPFGISILGIWSIIYKESAIKSPVATLTPFYEPPITTKGNTAVAMGIFYLILGLFVGWGVTGVVLGIMCNSHFCTNLPTFIKFF